MTKLKPCPFCGSKDIRITNKIEKNSTQTFYVWCLGCGTEGPFGLSPKSALDAWNKRS